MCYNFYNNMIERYTQKKTTWVDLREPTTEEVRTVMEECEIPPELLNDFTKPVPRSGITAAANAIKITFDFPVVKRTDIDGAHEIKFIISKSSLVTARYEDITAVHKFAKEFEVLSVLEKSTHKVHGGHLFTALMNTLYDSLEEKLDYLNSRMQTIEKEIFNQREKEMVSEISDVNRRLITFKQTLSVHEETFEVAPEIFAKIFGKSFSTQIEELRDRYHNLMRRVRTFNNILDELRETNTALLYTKQNEIMKILTIMAFVTFPLALISSIFGMNTVTSPIIGEPGDFWIVIGIMMTLTIVFFIFFKYKKWM